MSFVGFSGLASIKPLKTSTLVLRSLRNSGISIVIQIRLSSTPVSSAKAKVGALIPEQAVQMGTLHCGAESFLMP